VSKNVFNRYLAGLACTFAGAWLTDLTGSILPLALGGRASANNRRSLFKRPALGERNPVVRARGGFGERAPSSDSRPTAAPHPGISPAHATGHGQPGHRRHRLDGNRARTAPAAPRAREVPSSEACSPAVSRWNWTGSTSALTALTSLADRGPICREQLLDGIGQLRSIKRFRQSEGDAIEVRRDLTEARHEDNG